MSDRISNSEFLAVMNEAFRRGQEIRFTPSGSSMLPMLDGADDTVSLAKQSGRLKKYDVAFYRRPKTGQLVLHRVVKVLKDGGYVFSGDGQYFDEYGIADDDVLAVLTEFTHNGKEQRVTDLSYRLYIRRMMLKKRLRMFVSKVYHRIWKRK